MQLFLLILHVMLCFALILIILLQPGKDGASVFGGGGGGNQMYGPRGQANLLGRATTVVAALFMFTSISLAWYSSERTNSGSDIEGEIERLQQETTRSSAGASDKSGALSLPAPAIPEAQPETVPEAPAAPTEAGSGAAPVAPPTPAPGTPAAPADGNTPGGSDQP